MLSEVPCRGEDVAKSERGMKTQDSPFFSSSASSPLFSLMVTMPCIVTMKRRERLPMTLFLEAQS